MQAPSFITIIPPETHDGANFLQGFVIDRQVEKLLRNTASRRSAGLHRLEFAAVWDAAADFENDSAQRHAHGHFNQTDILNFAGEGKHLCALTLLCANGGVPIATMT